MSTLPGFASKTEKGKSKFQSLDINNLYRVSRGESLEKQQQKSTLPFKHGMQSLGRVPSARRPPANLPSIKSEHSGTDAAVSLVPSGGPGWGKQDSSTPLTTSTPQTATTPTNSNVSSPSATNTSLTAHQAAIAIPVTTTIPPPAQKHQQSAGAPAVAADKSWSSVMSSSDLLHPPPYQSPQFQHEFPSLSAGDGSGAPRPGTDTQYGPGPSLRPQTEGSWMQGGSRANAADAGGPPRSSSVPLGAPPQLSAQVGLPHQPLPPQYQGILPGFMFRGNATSNGHGTANITNIPPSVMSANRSRDNRSAPPQRHAEAEEIARRPIIKEEDLNRMDDMTKDMGWAAQEEIDYNQKLAFSDDESAPQHRKPRSENNLEKSDNRYPESSEQKAWSRGSMMSREEEILAQKRRQQQQVIVTAAERAKQRKEEEEKKYLEAKLKREQEEESQCGMAQSRESATPAPPGGEWEKEPQSSDEKKSPQEQNSDFRQLTSIEGRNFVRKDSRNNERNERNIERNDRSDRNDRNERNDRSDRGDRSGSGYSRQLQNLPPRLQKKQQFRNNASPQPPSYQYDGRYKPKGKSDWDGSDKEHDDKPKYGRQYSDSSRKLSESRYSDDGRDFDYKKEDLYAKRDKFDKKEDDKYSTDSISRQSSDEWHSDRLEKFKEEKVALDRYERPQRPDSRDSRHSRESEPHLSWSETINDERKPRVPGPITKEKIEADEKQSEKRNLTQLKKGSIPDKKDIIEERDETKQHKESSNIWNKQSESSKSWADDVVQETTSKDSKESSSSLKQDEFDKKDDLKSHPNRNRPLGNARGAPQGWERPSGVVYHGGYYNKKGRGGSRSGRPSSKLGEFHGTDSEESVVEEQLGADGSGKELQKSPKPVRKLEKDERNRDMKGVGDRKPEKYGEGKKEPYEPRGEPSRHGRGGGNIRGRGGLSKRIDGYGPPPSKSPFSHSEEKDGSKKLSTEDVHSETSAYDEISTTSHQANAGVIGSVRRDHQSGSQLRNDRKNDDKFDRNKSRRGPFMDPKKPIGSKPRKDENGGDTSEHSDDSANKNRHKISRPQGQPQGMRRNPPPPRMAQEKRVGGFGGGVQQQSTVRQNSNGSLRPTQGKKEEKLPEQNSLCDAIAGISLIAKENEEQSLEVADLEEIADSDGFQEVKSKKNVKGKVEEKIKPKIDVSSAKSKPKPHGGYISQQQIANIPSLMDTPVNPPAVIPQPQQNKNQYDRSRHKLPPRFAKQRENNRLQKAQMQQQHGSGSICDINELNKVNQNMNLYAMKEQNLPLSTNAWEKPLTAQMRDVSDMGIGGLENCKAEDSTQNLSPKTAQDKSVLDGATPPVNTIIFENTNFKTGPGVRNRGEKPTKIEDNSVFNKPISELLNKNDIQIQFSLNKEDSADMKLDFFDSDISHLTDDKSSKNISLPRSNSTISPSTADLNFKIASVKKVWDNSMPPVIEHSNADDSFSSSFDPNSLDSSAFGKAPDASEEPHEGYSPSPSQNTTSNTTNVCKVKPTQQAPGTVGQSIAHQPHSGIMTSGLMQPLSSPPIQPVIGPNVGLNQAPQQYTASQHLGYQAGIGGSTQFGMPAVPSPPNVLFNSAQQIQPNLYGGYAIDQLGGQRTSQFSQYPYNLGQNASSHYSAQSLYLQTQPHPPPTAQAPPDIYQSLQNYRMPNNTGPFGQTQQLNNPTTVLISSTSNSLMSASVKPSNQPISAIGTKAGAVGQTYQPQSQQGPLYMYEPTIQPNYLQSTGVLQRGPTGPVQNNVVQALQPSSSFYSGSTGGQTGYFQQPGSSTLQSGPLQQHQASYGLPGNVFGTHNQSHSSPNMNLGSQLFSQMQFAAAMNVQAFRSQGLQNPSYLKGMAGQQVGQDQGGRSQQLKSPGSQQEVLSSVFNSGPQIPSPKSRQNCKQPPPQPSPTTQHKYSNLYQGVGNQSNQQQRYPTPIQRPPMNYQPNMNSVQNNASNNQKHRPNASKGPGGRQQYYSTQGPLSSQGEKQDEGKLTEHGGQRDISGGTGASGGGGIVGKTNLGSVSSASLTKTEMTKDEKESSAIKD